MSPEIDFTNSNINWVRLQPGYKIINLTAPYYNQVIDLIKDHYLSQDIITKCTNMVHDETSIKSFLEHVLHIIQDGHSIILVEETKLRVIGLLLINVVTKISFGRVYSRYNLNHGEAYNKYIELKTALNKKTDIFLDFNCDFFMRFYLLCIHNDYLNTNFGYYLLRCGIDVCRSLHVPIACAIFPNEEFQKCAELVGFKSIYKIKYSDYTDKSGEVILDAEVLKHADCSLMVATVPEPDVISYTIPEKAAATKKQEKSQKMDEKNKNKK